MGPTSSGTRKYINLLLLPSEASRLSAIENAQNYSISFKISRVEMAAFSALCLLVVVASAVAQVGCI